MPYLLALLHDFDLPALRDLRRSLVQDSRARDNLFDRIAASPQLSSLELEIRWGGPEPDLPPGFPPSLSIPHLQHLELMENKHYWPPDADSSFLASLLALDGKQLPLSLRSLSISAASPPFMPLICRLLERVGPTLTHLTLLSPYIALPAQILSLCPILQTFTLELTSIGETTRQRALSFKERISNILTSSHPHIHTLIVFGLDHWTNLTELVELSRALRSFGRGHLSPAAGRPFPSLTTISVRGLSFRTWRDEGQEDWGEDHWALFVGACESAGLELQDTDGEVWRDWAGEISSWGVDRPDQ